MACRWMVWNGSTFQRFASRYLACLAADELAIQRRAVVHVETVRRCAVIYTADGRAGGRRVSGGFSR